MPRDPEDNASDDDDELGDDDATADDASDDDAEPADDDSEVATNDDGKSAKESEALAEPFLRDGVQFEPLGCQNDGGGDFSCVFTVEATEGDVAFSLPRLDGGFSCSATPVVAFDDVGNEYETTRVELANLSIASGCNLEGTLVGCVKTRVTYHFSDLDADATAIAQLRASPSIDGNAHALVLGSLPLVGPEDLPEPQIDACDPPSGSSAETDFQRLGVGFSFDACENLGGGQFVCPFSVLSENADATVYLTYENGGFSCVGVPALAFDEYGNQYAATQLTIASNVAGQCGANTELIADVARQAELSFEGLDADATEITLLRMGPSVDGTGTEISARGLALQ